MKYVKIYSIYFNDCITIRNKAFFNIGPYMMGILDGNIRWEINVPKCDKFLHLQMQPLCMFGVGDWL